MARRTPARERLSEQARYHPQAARDRNADADRIDTRDRRPAGIVRARVISQHESSAQRPENFAHVVQCFLKRRNPAILAHISGPRIVRSQRQRHIAAELIEQLREVVHTPLNVLRSVMRINPEALGSSRHQLKDADRTDRGNGRLVIVAFLFRNRQRERGINPAIDRRLRDLRLDLISCHAHNYLAK